MVVLKVATSGVRKGGRPTVSWRLGAGWHLMLSLLMSTTCNNISKFCLITMMSRSEQAFLETEQADTMIPIYALTDRDNPLTTNSDFLARESTISGGCGSGAMGFVASQTHQHTKFSVQVCCLIKFVRGSKVRRSFLFHLFIINNLRLKTISIRTGLMLRVIQSTNILLYLCLILLYGCPQ